MLDGRNGTLAVTRSVAERLAKRYGQAWLDSTVRLRHQGQERFMAQLELNHQIHCLVSWETCLHIYIYQSSMYGASQFSPDPAEQRNMLFPRLFPKSSTSSGDLFICPHHSMSFERLRTLTTTMTKILARCMATWVSSKHAMHATRRRFLFSSLSKMGRVGSEKTFWYSSYQLTEWLGHHRSLYRDHSRSTDVQ